MLFFWSFLPSEWDLLPFFFTFSSLLCLMFLNAQYLLPLQSHGAGFCSVDPVTACIVAVLLDTCKAQHAWSRQMFPDAALQNRSIIIPAAWRDSLLLSHALPPKLIWHVEGGIFLIRCLRPMWQGKTLQKLEDMDHYMHVLSYLFPEDRALFIDKLHWCSL